MTPDEQDRVNMFIGALLRRLGGQVHVEEKELIPAQILYDDVDDGMTAMILPDYIAIGEEPAPAPRTYDDVELADILKEMRKYEQPLKYEGRQLQGKDGKISIRNPDGSLTPIATKTEWTLAHRRDDDDEPTLVPV